MKNTTSSSKKSHLLQMRGLKLVNTAPVVITCVASFTDAWIETYVSRIIDSGLASHLLQMRGLKLLSRVPLLLPKNRSHLLQMRGLKR